MIRSYRQPESARRVCRLVAAWLVAACMLMIAASPAVAGTVRLQARAWADGPEVTLSQIAELQGDEVQAFGSIVVGRFAEGVDTLTITLADVRKLMNEQKVHWGKISLQGFASCRVERSDAAGSRVAAPVNPVVIAPVRKTAGETQTATDAQNTLRSRIEALMVQLNGVPREQLTVTFREQDAAQLLRNVAQHRYTIEPATSATLGRVVLRVQRHEAELVAESFAVTVDVRRRMEAVVATASIARDEKFTAANVTVREVLLDGLRSGEPMSALSDVLNHEAAGLLREGSLIFGDDVRSPVLVRRGEVVKVRCMVGSLMITTEARAREAGQKGQIIQVRNEVSRENYMAQVTGRREVFVRLGEEVQEDSTQLAVRGDDQ